MVFHFFGFFNNSIDVKLNPTVMTRYELLSETMERNTMMLFNVEIKCFIKLFFSCSLLFLIASSVDILYFEFLFSVLVIFPCCALNQA